MTEHAADEKPEIKKKAYTTQKTQEKYLFAQEKLLTDSFELI